MNKINNSSEASLLKRSLSACAERIKSLEYSLAKNKGLFPLNVNAVEQLSEDQKESIDAFILRYTQCVSMLQDQLFNGVLIAEQEDFKELSARGKSMLMERLGAINSAKEFGAAAVLRNKFAHHYPEESGEQLTKLNELTKESEFVIGVFENLVEYIDKNEFTLEDVSQVEADGNFPRG
jgi:hypothetical protein